MLQARAAQLDRNSGLTYWLLDATDFTVQTSTVAELFCHSLPPLITDAVVALATPHVLSAMQAKRASANHRQHRFDTVEEAEAWLAEMRQAE